MSEVGHIQWTRYKLSRLELSHAAALLVLQGLPLGRLFQGCSFSSPNSELYGNFIFLAGQLTPFYRSPVALNDIILAKIHALPAQLREEEVLGALLQSTPFPS